MADLLDALKRPDPALTPAPAAEVRRRGDRIRRRRRAAQVGGAATVVAVALAVPLLLSGVGTGDSAPPVLTTPMPLRPAPTALPDDLPLTVGWPDPGGDGTVRTGPRTPPVGDIAYCGKAAYPVLDPAARRTARLSMPAETRSREVTSYGKETSAHDAVQAFVGAATGCPSSQEGPSATTYQVRKLTTGDESFAVLAAPETEGAIGIESIVLVRVGNVVVLSTRYGEGTGDRVAQQALDDERQLVPLVQAVDRPAGADSVLTFEGLGALRLGMNRDDLAATGQVTLATPVRNAACDGVVVDRWGRLENEVDGYLSRRLGLAAIFARNADTVTEEGIRIGSSTSALRGAYPAASDEGGGTVRVTDADHPGRMLTFTVEDGKVTGFGAALTKQDCYG